jgi:hypothetical protein
MTGGTQRRRRPRFRFGKRPSRRQCQVTVNGKKTDMLTCPDIIDKLLLALQEQQQQQQSMISEEEEKVETEGRQDGNIHNRRHDEELYRLCREATEACLREVISHLHNFIQDSEDCDVKYEDWIKDVHPENVDGSRVDHRFYVKDSEHLSIWNAFMEKLNRESKMVSPRTILMRQDSFQGYSSPRQ